MDSFVFVQIASLCLSDQKDVSLCPNIPYHYTGAGGPQGGAAVGQAPGAVPLSAQHHLAGGPHPHPLQSKGKPTLPLPYLTEAQPWPPVFYLTLQRGLFPGCALSLF